MQTPTSVSAELSQTGKTLSFETGKLSQQSQGAVVARYGDTMVLATANAAKTVRDGIDFFPLTIDVEERMYAAGKIPGSFFRREGRPTDHAILTCRLIDRPLRPNFPEGYRNETQVVITILGADQENPHDILAINAASAALMISGIPFECAIGAVRMAWTAEGKWIPNPTFEQGDESTFELVVAGRVLDNGDVAIMMVEAGGTETSWKLYQDGTPMVNEEVVAQGLEESKQWIRESIELQDKLVAAVGPIEQLTYEVQVDYTQDIYNKVVELATSDLTKVVTIAGKAERNAETEAVIDTLKTALAEQFPDSGRMISAAVKSLSKKLVRKRIVDEGLRIDGRGPKQLRPLSAEVGVIPTAHGTGLFQRGETQVLNVCTLGMPKMNQMLDSITTDTDKRYMHHYNMPPSANGETGRVGSPKRREVGHGLLGERALLPVVPPMDEFPYTLRLVSEVLASNGSTSMASVCGSTLSMMDAGVPLKAPVGGIAMGLIFENGKYTTLTDITGTEDGFGDMDFKVAGTADFVTALQLDTKIDGIPADVLGAALLQAKEARLEILAVMNKAISAPRTEVNGTAPKIISFEVPIDKVGEIIGPKGKVINTMQQETGADISVDDVDGKYGVVTIGSKDSAAVNDARTRIELIINPPKAEIGAVYNGKVVSVTKFGAFINILPGRDGLIHISKMGGGKRINQVEDVLNLGDELEVRVEDVDPQGKVSLIPVNALVAGESDGGESSGGASTGGRATMSFEDEFSAELTAEIGDLGPAQAAPREPREGGRGASRGGNGGGGRSRGGRR